MIRGLQVQVALAHGSEGLRTCHATWQVLDTAGNMVVTSDEPVVCWKPAASGVYLVTVTLASAGAMIYTRTITVIAGMYGIDIGQGLSLYKIDIM